MEKNSPASCLEIAPKDDAVCSVRAMNALSTQFANQMCIENLPAKAKTNTACTKEESGRKIKGEGDMILQLYNKMWLSLIEKKG